MAGTTVVQPAPITSLQGVAIPGAIVDQEKFYKKTRRHTQQEKSSSYTGQPTDTFELRKADILSEIIVRFTGSVVVTPGTGSVASTARWPYDFFKAIRFAANGASNLMNASGWKYKVRDFCKNTDLNDRGVTQTVGGVARNQGTLSTNSEAWGVGSNTSAIGAGTYSVDFEVVIPVAEDQVDLAGAIFLQTATADLTLAVDYESVANLFTLAGNATVAISGTTQVWTTKWAIPTDASMIIVPDLSVFHQFIQSSYTALQSGVDNEVRIVGQGAGKSALRIIYQHWSGTPQAPLAMTDANFGLQAWRYASNETPDMFVSGGHMRNVCERMYSSDVGGLFGFGVHEFSSMNALRDVVDMGTTAEIRLVSNVVAAITNPRLEYAVESVFLAGQGA